MNILRAEKAPYAVYFWIIIIIASLGVFTLYSSWSFFKMDAIIIWIFSILSLLFLSKKKSHHLDEREKIAFFCLGICLICLGVLNIPLGFGHPPFSIGDFSIILSGISVLFFSYIGYKILIYPVLFPAVAVVGFQLYDLLIDNFKWLSIQLIPLITFLAIFFLHILGIPVEVDGNLITLTSLNGELINLLITENCSGIWSLGTFTICTFIMIINFPKILNPKGILFIAIGFIGTFFSNIFRVILIALVGYYFGSISAVSFAHDYFGWLVFSIWLIVFWYLFFRYIIGKDVIFKPKIKT